MRKFIIHRSAFIVFLLLVTCHLSLVTAFAKKHTHPPKGGGAVGTPLTINTIGLPDGQVGVAYSQLITASGGTTPYTFAVTSCSGATGCPPPSIALTTGSPSATLAGTPTAPGIYSFTVRATDSAAHTYSLSYALTIAASAAPSAPLFSDGFESGNFSAWTGIQDSTNDIVQSVIKRTGSYAAQIHYFICTDPANPACGNMTSQDRNMWVGEFFPSGLPSNATRWYLYLKHPEVGGTVDGVQRKLAYFWADPSNPGTLWSVIVKGESNGVGNVPVLMAVQNAGIGGWSASYYFNPAGYAYLNFDTWYSLELDIQDDTSVGVTWNGSLWSGACNGVMRLYVNGTDVSSLGYLSLGYNGNVGYSVVPANNVCLNLGTANPLKAFFLGFQANRFNGAKVDEYRYIDDVVINNTGPIGP